MNARILAAAGFFVISAGLTFTAVATAVDDATTHAASELTCPTLPPTTIDNGNSGNGGGGGNNGNGNGNTTTTAPGGGGGTSTAVSGPSTTAGRPSTTAGGGGAGTSTSSLPGASTTAPGGGPSTGTAPGGTAPPTTAYCPCATTSVAR